MFENIDEKTARTNRRELDRNFWYELTKFHFVYGFGEGIKEFTREDLGLVEFEIDQLRRVESQEALIIPSEFVGKGNGKYVIYSKTKYPIVLRDVKSSF